jgi:hypothetical protein
VVSVIGRFLLSSSAKRKYQHPPLSDLIEVAEIQAGVAEVAVNGQTYQVSIENDAEVATGN